MLFSELFYRKKFGVCFIGKEGDQDGAGGAGVTPPAEDISESQRDLIIRTVNAAVSTQFGRKLPGAIEHAMAAAIAPLQESIKGLVPQEAAGDPKPESGAAVSPQIAEMLRKQKALEGQLAEERKAREDQANAARESTRKARLTEALSKAGVEPLRMRGAMAEVADSVHLGDDGKIYYRDTSKGYEEDLPLDKGMERWSSSDVGKSYMAPKQVGGSGQHTPYNRTSRRTTPTDPKEAKAARIAEARQTLRDGVRQMLGGDGDIQLGGQSE